MSWESINNEIEAGLKAGDKQAVDTVRRQKLKKISEVTGRATLLYAVEMSDVDKIRNAKGATGIELNDKDGFREALANIDGGEIDVVIQSPGGSPEATESLVKMIRKRFSDVRFLIPSVAKSAATMLACSGNEIILGEEAELGPTDPQMVIGGRAYPAHAILEQFDLAKREIRGASKLLPAWLPILEKYGPSLLQECQNAIKLTTVLVKEWLADYMFNAEKRSKQKAVFVSKYLSSNKHLSHSRGLNIEELKRRGVHIKYTNEVSKEFSDALLDLHHAVGQTFSRTGAYKIFENHEGRGFYRVLQVIVVPQK